MDTFVAKPRFLEPTFQEKRKRPENQNGNLTVEEVEFQGAVVGTLDATEDVVVVDDFPTMTALQKPDYCYGQLFPLPYARRVKGKLCVSEDPLPSAAEIRAQGVPQKATEEPKPKEVATSWAEWAEKRKEQEPVPDEPPKSVKLSLVEALYLSTDLEQLEILIDRDNRAAFQPDDFFSYCCGTIGGLEFASRYAAYRYYRRKGWVVKDGETFGVTFVLYKSHPSKYHSTFGVLVVTQQPKPFSWRKMSCLCRELSTVSKGLIVCTVSSDFADTSDLSRADVDRFRISEMHVSSWFAGPHSQQRPDSEAGSSKGGGDAGK